VGPSGREVISLQKMDSSLMFLNVNGSQKGFMRCNAGGIWIKINLNPKAKTDSVVTAGLLDEVL
jgi:hypothetical protein